MLMVGYSHQGEEDVIYVAYFKIICAVGVERREKGSALLEKVQDLFHSVYFEYEENFTHDRLLSLNYAFCHIKRLIKTSEPVYTD